MPRQGMNGRWRWTLGLAVAIFWGLVWTGPGYGETLRFVFFADSRASAATAPICPNQPLINTCALNAINSQILALSPQPSFVVFGGDMSYRGYINGAYTYQQFRDAMKQVTDAGIKLYVTLGNHEMYHETNPMPPAPFPYYLVDQQQYQLVFNDMPQNGPPGYGSLAYSFESPGKDCFFAVLDPYYITQPVYQPANINGQVDDTQLTWLTNQIAQTQASHKFLFIHVPYYLVAGTAPVPVQDSSYTKLWKILDDNRFDIYFCGHTHLYSRKTIDSQVQPSPQLNPPVQWKNNVVQLLCGTAGAEATTDPLLVNQAAWHIHMNPNTYYFSVVDINGSQVTVTSYSGSTSGNYNIVDSFTVPPSSTAVHNLLLSD